MDQRLEFHWDQSLPFPLPLRSLCSICALVQIFYCFLCTSQTLFHWLSIIMLQSKSLFIGCCDSVHRSWTTRSEWRVMASLKEPVCRKEDYLLIDIGTLYRVISSFSYSDAEKFQFIESVWKPDLLFEFPASKETSRKQRKFRQNHRGS